MVPFQCVQVFMLVSLFYCKDGDCCSDHFTDTDDGSFASLVDEFDPVFTIWFNRAFLQAVFDKIGMNAPLERLDEYVAFDLHVVV